LKKIKANEIFFPLTAVLPIAVSMAVCSDIVTTAFFLSALFYSVFYKKSNEKVPMQVYLDFLLLNQVNAIYGINTAWLGIIIGGLLLIISSVWGDKLKNLISPAVTSAIMISAAFSMTALQTTNYFGIGATGNTVVEILKNYRSLGFHPNWRGILYGTIVMVIMITFPRKFKKLSKIIKAPFIALLFVMLLNILLVPDGFISPFEEVGKIKIELYPKWHSFNDIDYIHAILCGIAFWATNFSLYSNENHTDKVTGSIKAFFSSAILGICVPCPFNSGKIIIQRLICIIPILICIPLSIPFARTPVSACAVVLIVGAWQSVRWGELKKAFNNPVSIIGFLTTIAAIVFLDFSTGIIIASLVSILISDFSSKRCHKGISHKSEKTE